VVALEHRGRPVSAKCHHGVGIDPGVDQVAHTASAEIVHDPT
jgi:hypothetical protein